MAKKKATKQRAIKGDTYAAHEILNEYIGLGIDNKAIDHVLGKGHGLSELDDNNEEMQKVAMVCIIADFRAYCKTQGLNWASLVRKAGK